LLIDTVPSHPPDNMADCCCPVGEHDPGCYCGCRPLCEGGINCCLLPFLGSGCGKCLINNVTGPLWRTCDMLCGIDNKDPERPSGLNAVKAIVVLTYRPIKDVAKYKAAFAPYATKVQSETAGVRAMFSFIDKSRESTAIQVAWYDTPEVLAGIAKDAAVEACYTSNDKAFGAVYGVRSEVVKKALAETGVAYEYGSLPRGFMKNAPHPGFSSKTYPGPPMIWMSKRYVQPGRNPHIAKAFAKVGDLQYYTAPAFLSGFEYTADDTDIRGENNLSGPDMLWSLRFFNDYEMGHVAHFPKSLISWVPTRVLFTMIPELKGGLGAEYPVGLSFSTKEDIEKAIAYNAGNKAYDQHYWEDVIGPLPDMGKGMPVDVEVKGGAPTPSEIDPLTR